MYDIVVVGAGHAGCEAANICAKMGHKTALITININNIADMPCNPSIGGTAKGVIVREIDALGGLMGIVTDKSHFQIKMLNNSKGPAVMCLRAQADKIVYPKIMLGYLKENKNLDIIEGTVEKLIINENKISGILLKQGKTINARCVILTTGTYLKSNVLIGTDNVISGPHGEQRSDLLSDNLRELGFTIIRLKTGTPPRISSKSINYGLLQEETGDNIYHTFSHDIKPQYKIDKQQKCYLLYTNEKTHQIIRDNLQKSAMYGGLVTGIGPRYCPSIEDKVVRFSDKTRHQLFLEPESLYYDDWYLQGFSTSMPKDIQEEMIHSLTGLEKANITKYAYAIEYDAIDSKMINSSLETKLIENLYTAGQINGTSGYEEAACQGLMAGINASLKLENREPFILKRNEAYIGVLIDDLITKGIKDPYRMLTSRAEFRLLLRHDNADLRLREYGYNLGTISIEQYNKLLEKKENIEKLLNELRVQKLTIDNETLKIFKKNNISVPKTCKSFYELLKRPEINFKFIDEIYMMNYEEEVKYQVEITLKYMGYINKAYKEAEKLKKLEEKIIPRDIDYDKVKNIASEARQKLKEIRPLSIAQAARISGVNPVDISILGIYLKKEYNNE